MGGNINLNSVKPDKIDLNKIYRWHLVTELYSMMYKINDEIYKKNKHFIWYHHLQYFFSGSSEHLVNPEISTNEIIKYKPIFGDIDILVNENYKDILINLFIENKIFGNMKLIGFKVILDEIHTIFELNNIKIQIDFDLVKFNKKDLPIEFAYFGKSCNWDDLKLGIKGVFHKLLLNSIDAAYSKHIEIYSEKTLKFKEIKFTQLNTFYVKKGFRERYRQFDKNKWYEVKSSNNPYYISDLKEIFKLLFKREPLLHENEIKDMWSFCGLIKIIEYSFAIKYQKNIIDAYMDKIYGKKSKIFGNTKIEDLKMKENTLSYIKNNIPSLKNYIEQKEKEYLNEFNNDSKGSLWK